MSRRTDKVASVMQHEVGNFILAQELPALTTISKTEVTPDLKFSKIWITVLGDAAAQKEVLNVLLGKKRELQEFLNDKLTMKFVPRIRFVIDHGEEYAAHINELLRETNE